jgi:MoaA/NifB/PqqE/SkfB family radical SAM enzyme
LDANIALNQPRSWCSTRSPQCAAQAEAITCQASCFGGRELFFIEPDGSVWDCPSSLKIAATHAWRRRTIRGHAAADLFTITARCTDCALFSRDCVNMWPLMGFGAFALTGKAGQ